MEWFMVPQSFSGPECFIAEVAGDDDSFKMVCFNVIFYVLAPPFLSTNFAQMSKTSSIHNFVLASPHQRHHPCFNFLKVARWKMVWNSQCSTLSGIMYFADSFFDEVFFYLCASVSRWEFCRQILFINFKILSSLSQNTDFSKNRLTLLTRHVNW